MQSTGRATQRTPPLRFFEVTPRLLFKGGYYSRAVTFQGGYYSRAVTFQGGYYSRAVTFQGGYYSTAVTIQRRLLCRAVTIQRRLLFKRGGGGLLVSEKEGTTLECKARGERRNAGHHCASWTRCESHADTSTKTAFFTFSPATVKVHRQWHPKPLKPGALPWTRPNPAAPRTSTAETAPHCRVASQTRRPCCSAMSCTASDHDAVTPRSRVPNPFLGWRAAIANATVRPPNGPPTGLYPPDLASQPLVQPPVTAAVLT